MNHITNEKHLLRTSISKRIQSMSDDSRQAEGRSVSRRLLDMIPEGSVVCGYFPLKTEVDIRPLLLTLLQRRDTVYLPVFENNRLIYRKIENLTSLKTGELNIPEPLPDTPKMEHSEPDVILVPGRAFDRKCNRLGRGAGGYDRWIAKHRAFNSETVFIGVALECQIVNEVPCEEHDQPLDKVVTAREIFITKGDEDFS